MKKVEEQCRSMSDGELVAALTICREEYTEAFAGVAEEELRKRGGSVEGFLNRVVVGVEGEEEAETTIAGALDRLKAMVQPFGMIGFTNCMGGRILFQRASLCWRVHDLSGGMGEPLFMTTDQEAGQALKRFLKLEAGQQAGERGMQRDAWTILGGKETEADVMVICAALAEEGIPSALEKQGEAGGCGRGACAGDKPVIVVEKHRLDRARSILEALEETVESLYARASELEEEGDTEGELAVLGRLAELVPQDGTVHFNRGVLLYDAERFQEAADSFTVAAFNRGDMEIRQDAIDYLVEILEHIPENTVLLHNLASLSMESGDTEEAERYFGRIVESEPDDAVAHLNLGLICYAHSDDRDRVLYHLKRFLAVSPDSSERVEAERIVGELG